jgi:hypothetical protein
MSPLHRIIAKKNPALAAQLERQLQARNAENAARLSALQRAAAVCLRGEDHLSVEERDFVAMASVMVQENYGGLSEAQERMLFALESRIGECATERRTRFSMLVH